MSQLDAFFSRIKSISLCLQSLYMFTLSSTLSSSLSLHVALTLRSPGYNGLIFRIHEVVGLSFKGWVDFLNVLSLKSFLFPIFVAEVLRNVG